MRFPRPRTPLDARGATRAPLALALALVALIAPLAPAVGTTARRVRIGARCPWLAAAATHAETPSQLAADVLAHMSLTDKLDVVDLSASHGYENRTTPIPSLCIPALTLQDGPNGIAFHDRGVSQLPASIGIAATFNPSVALDYGRLEGNEARRQGLDVIQGPNLNIARVPESGREFEGYGEDPLLVSRMGVADIEGIQSEGVMADAKHFGVYTQETDRIPLDQAVSERALQEIYFPPFKAAVTEADVASLMCAYGRINQVETCADPALFRMLRRSWGFEGFVRSDLAALANPVAGFAAGLDAIKPSAQHAIVNALATGNLGAARLDHAVMRVLTEMFAYGLIAHPLRGHPRLAVATKSHASFALSAAEQSMVLLKDRGGVLPLRRKPGERIAVIGVDASTEARSAGGGSAHVIPPFVSTPLAALRAALGRHVTLSYQPGGSSLDPAPMITGVESALGVSRLAAPKLAAVGTGSLAGDVVGMHHWLARVIAKATGTYVITLADNGDAWLDVNGIPAISSPGLHGRAVWSVQEQFRAGEVVHLTLSWYHLAREGPPVVGWRYAGDAIADAVRAARHASVAIVFAGVFASEGVDRPTLSLPSDENALISAVAAANPHTVVVLNSPGAVFMPWLSRVAGVLEAWYPGEQDGAATAAVLTGKVDPAGHLPVTFPANQSGTSAHSLATWPGVDGVVHLDEGLDVGYRYDSAYRIRPLFPFGFGLSYTTFSLADLVVSRSNSGEVADVAVTNTGHRSGSEVVQAYLTFPASAGEPPINLVGFTRVTVAPGRTKEIQLSIPRSAFMTYLGSSWVEVPGAYTLHVGTSSANLPLALNLLSPGSPGVPIAVPAAGPSGPSAGAQIARSGQPLGALANEPLLHHVVQWEAKVGHL